MLNSKQIKEMVYPAKWAQASELVTGAPIASWFADDVAETKYTRTLVSLDFADENMPHVLILQAIAHDGFLAMVDNCHMHGLRSQPVMGCRFAWCEWTPDGLVANVSHDATWDDGAGIDTQFDKLRLAILSL